MPWEPPDIDTDQDAVTDRILDGLAERLPGWEAVEGAPEVALAEEFGREVAILNQTAQDVQEYAVAGMGQTAFGFPAYLGAAAEIEVDVTVSYKSSGGAGPVPGGVRVTIPAGLTVVGVNDNGDEVAFELTSDVSRYVLGIDDHIVHLTMTATVEGDAGNNVPAGALTVVTATTNVIDVTATAASSNGADPETMLGYLDRLVDYLATLRPGGVNAADLAALARSVPGVDRAFAADLYDPDDPDEPAERTVTVFPVDENNAAVTGSVITRVQAALEEAREVNFVIHVAAPTYTAVHVHYTAVAETGQDPTVVRTNLEAVIGSWLTSFGATSQDPNDWQPLTTVRLLELARVAGNATGVAALLSLDINGTTADLELDGVAPLPAPLNDPDDPSTVSGTVS